MEDAFKVGDLVQRRLGYAPSEWDDRVGLVVEIKSGSQCPGNSWIHASIGVVWAHKPGVTLWSDPRDICGCQDD